MDSFELQEELERFTTRFCDRVTHAAAVLELSEREEARDAGLRQALRYVSSAMEIATGLAPQVNLLDMITFVHLSRSMADRYWLPEVYGSDGVELSQALADAERELTDLAIRELGEGAYDQVVALADGWLAANPGSTRVEGVRLADFSAEAGAAASARASQARGLLASVKTATRTANQAMVLSERGLFLFHRLPFLWRLQARLAAREMLRDALEIIAQRTARFMRLARRALLAGGAVATAGTLGTVLVLRARARRSLAR